MRDLQAYLDLGDVRSVAGEEELLHRERRVGLYRGNARTATQGFLYSADYLRLPDRGPGVAFACRATFEGDVPPIAANLVPLGGESRRALVRVEEQVMPTCPHTFDGGRLLLYLATPSSFARGWRPDLPSTATIVRAVVNGPQPVTGWVRGRGPRPIRWAVAAGSIYFVRFESEDAASRFAADTHGRCLAQDLPERLATAGYGLALTGRW